MLRALALIPMSAAASYCLGLALSNDWSEEDNQNQTLEAVSGEQSTEVSSSNQAKNDSELPDSQTITAPQASAAPLFAPTQSPLQETPLQENNRQFPTPPAINQPPISQVNLAPVLPPLPPAPVSPLRIVETLPIDKIVDRSIGSNIKQIIPLNDISNNSVEVPPQLHAEATTTDNTNNNLLEVSTAPPTETIPSFSPVSQPPEPTTVSTTSELVTEPTEITPLVMLKVNKQPKAQLVVNNSSQRLENTGELIVADANLAQSNLGHLLAVDEEAQEIVIPSSLEQQLSQTLLETESPEIVPPPAFPEPVQTETSSNATEQIQISKSPALETISRVVDETYTLGAGDVISVNIFRVPEFSGEQRVSVDGSLNLPLVGKLRVEGLTIEQAENAITSFYQPELRSPAVTVSLLQPRPLQVAISGEIQQPGSYVLPLINNAQFPSLAQAVQVAGGMTQAADLERVQVRRSQASGLTQTISVNLWKLLQEGDLSQDLTLRDGDVIIIPTTTDVDFYQTAQLGASNLASTSVSSDVAVVGEVFRPGAYRLAGGNDGASRPTVSQAIQTAGGIRPSANVRQIQVRRPTRNGTEQLIKVDLWQLLQDGDLSQDLALQEGDTVMIPTATGISVAEAAQVASTNLSPDIIRINLGGEVSQPGTVQVPSNTTLNEALLSVGGFNERAEETVELIRFKPDGSLERREINVNLSQGIDPETNPLLWHNDVIIAGRSRAARITDKISDLLGPFMQILPPLRSFL